MLAPRRTRARPAIAALAVAIVLPAPAAPSEEPLHEAAAPVYAIRITHEATAGTLRRVLDDARERLSWPACQRVIDDFVAGDGRPLRSHLRELGYAPGTYLEMLVFYDGGSQRRCQQKGNLAVTQVGSRAVYVCPEALRARARRNPTWAEAALIHEALHSLGLGENPPSSQEITWQVIRCCRR